MTSIRDTALTFGRLTYNNGKPCRRGHFSDRYSSNGMCIECLKLQAGERKLKVDGSRAARNKALFDQLQPKQVWVRPQHHAAISEYADVLRYGSPDVIAQCVAFIAWAKTQ